MDDDDDLSDLIPEIIVLSPEDFEQVLDMIENPRPPTQALIDLMKTHSRLLKED